jgi:hypothetical protein
MAGLRSRKPRHTRRQSGILVVVVMLISWPGTVVVVVWPTKVVLVVLVAWPAKVVVVTPVELVLLLVVVEVLVVVVGVQRLSVSRSSVLHVIAAEHCEQHAA